MSMEEKINYLKRKCAELRQENVDLREHLTIMYVDKFNQKVKLENKAKVAWMDGYDIGAADEREANQVGDPSEY